MPDTTSVYLQEACLRHQFIRSKDTSNVVERPERLRAVNVGLAAIIARIEAALFKPQAIPPSISVSNPDDELTAALEKLQIESSTKYLSPNFPLKVIKSNATLKLLNHPAVKFIHGDIERDVYLENLIRWTKESRDKIASEGSEIPAGLAQGDLYLCPTSVEAIQGALATVCEAVDDVMVSSRQVQGQAESSPHRAFVAVRPPGHHCGENTPSGFCFVNNVAVGAAHAHLKHGISRAIIFDIDLHHGNGTQSLIWQINEETYRQKLEEVHGAPEKPGLQVYYGSVHDILSYPCEDGKTDLVQAASTSIHGPHGQYIENIHLLPYTSEDHFWSELYEKRYSQLFAKAHKFVEETGSVTDDVLVFISCGFDACEHEFESMSRHGRKVPVGFYERFARDARAFADQVAGGRLISVLEGGYSDRALTSGVMAHLAGLACDDSIQADSRWWGVDNLELLERATKKRKGGRSSLTGPLEPWLERSLEIFGTIDSVPPIAQAVPPPMSMSLRDRSKPSSPVPFESVPLPPSKPVSKRKPKEKPVSTVKQAPQNIQKIKEDLTGLSETITPTSSSTEVRIKQEQPETATASKKIPRVVLKLGPRPPNIDEGIKRGPESLSQL